VLGEVNMDPKPMLESDRELEVGWATGSGRGAGSELGTAVSTSPSSFDKISSNVFKYDGT
jgi:hypothetical protein